jgi:O-acetyl-ADP-ribose deacetylase
MNQVLREQMLPSGQILQLVQGDITTETVDAIVNAANSQLQHGGGVAGGISRRGGPAIQAESDVWVRQNGAVSHDRPAYTSAGKLPCRFVIHAVGPIWGSGDEDAKLSSAVSGSLRMAMQLNLKSISFPAISTGIFGFPKGRAAKCILKTIRDFFTHHPESPLKQIRIVLFDQPTLDVFNIEF